VLSCVLVAGLIATAACGSDESGDRLEGESTVMESNPSWEGEDIELEFWTFVNNHAEFLVNRAIEFNETNSEYNILLNAVTADYGDMHDRLLISLQAGTGAPDLADIEIGRFGTFLRGDVPLHPLTDVVDRYRNELVEERLAPYQVGGVEYGIDYHLGAYVMYYNVEIMEAAGIDINEIVSWDDYIEAGKLVQEHTDATMTTIEVIAPFSILGLMKQNGGGTYDRNNQLIVDSPQNVEALQLVAEMVHEHGIAVAAPGGDHHAPTYFEAFNAGEFASVWMPQWYMIRYPDQMPDTEGKMRVRPLPEFRPGGFISTMGGGTGTAITNQIDEDKLEAAKLFLEFAKLTYEAQVELWTDLGFDPFRGDVYGDPALAGTDPWFGDEPVLRNISLMFDRLAPEYTGPRYPEATSQLGEYVAFTIVEEGTSPQDALATAARDVRFLDE
jgi:arabinosaccharide transport system substrate-binding protein